MQEKEKISGDVSVKSASPLIVSMWALTLFLHLLCPCVPETDGLVEDEFFIC